MDSVDWSACPWRKSRPWREPVLFTRKEKARAGEFLSQKHVHFSDPDARLEEGRLLQQALESKRQGSRCEPPPSTDVLEDSWHPWPKASQEGTVVVESTFSYKTYCAMREAADMPGVASPWVADAGEKERLDAFYAERRQTQKVVSFSATDEVQAAIRDLRQLAEGTIGQKWFLTKECPHAVNTLMWVLQHGSPCFRVHALRAQLAASDGLIRNINCSLGSVRNAMETKQTLLELQARVGYPILRQAAIMCDDEEVAVLDFSAV